MTVAQYVVNMFKSCNPFNSINSEDLKTSLYIFKDHTRYSYSYIDSKLYIRRFENYLAIFHSFNSKVCININFDTHDNCIEITLYDYSKCKISLEYIIKKYKYLSYYNNSNTYSVIIDPQGKIKDYSLLHLLMYGGCKGIMNMLTDFE